MNSPECNSGTDSKVFNNPEGVKQSFMFNPFGIIRYLPYLFFSELYSELFKFNAFSVFRFVAMVNVLNLR